MSLEDHAQNEGHRDQISKDVDDSEYMWLSGTAPIPIHHALKDFEQSYLRCPICHDFFRNAVYIKTCRHAFCSECVRKSLKSGLASMRRKQDCPTCKVEVKDENLELVPDFGLQRCVNEFKALRGPLKTALDSSHNNIGVSIQSSNRNECKMEGKIGKKRSRDESSSVTLEGLQTQPQQIKGSVNMRNSYTSLQRKPTPLYHSMKKKQLESLCRDAGLSCKGSEKELMDRHHTYILLWNAECDSETPRTEGEIIKELNRREMLKSHAIMKQSYSVDRVTSGHVETLKQNLKNGTISTGDVEADKLINHGFQKLIEEARKKKGVAPKSSDSIIYIDEERCENIHATCATDETVDTPHVNGESAESNKYAKVCDSIDLETNCIEEKKDIWVIPSNASNESDGQSARKENTKNPYKKDETPKATLRDSLVNTSPALSSSNPYSKRRSTEASITAEWSCSRCTFINTKTWRGAKCEMCSFSRLS